MDGDDVAGDEQEVILRDRWTLRLLTESPLAVERFPRHDDRQIIRRVVVLELVPCQQRAMAVAGPVEVTRLMVLRGIMRIRLVAGETIAVVWREDFVRGARD